MKRRSATLAVFLAGSLVACGGSDDSRKRFDPFSEVRDRTVVSPRRASPRWERVATLAGSSAARPRFEVAREAIQWRARWRCRTGRLALSTSRRHLAAARCPSRGTTTDVSTGPVGLRVEASAPWRIIVEQQVDTPLHEPPLAAMRSPGARVIARGRFYPLERHGRGTALLYRLADGRMAVRFEGFSTSANTDLFVWLSTAARPRSTVQAARSRHVVLRTLKSTLGEQNYVVPRGVRLDDIRSVVIWCVPVRIAYTAASFRRPAGASETNSP